MKIQNGVEGDDRQYYEQTFSSGESVPCVKEKIIREARQFLIHDDDDDHDAHGEFNPLFQLGDSYTGCMKRHPNWEQLKEFDIDFYEFLVYGKVK